MKAISDLIHSTCMKKELSPKGQFPNNDDYWDFVQTCWFESAGEIRKQFIDEGLSNSLKEIDEFVNSQFGFVEAHNRDKQFKIYYGESQE